MTKIFEKHPAPWCVQPDGDVIDAAGCRLALIRDDVCDFVVKCVNWVAHADSIHADTIVEMICDLTRERDKFRKMWREMSKLAGDAAQARDISHQDYTALVNLKNMIEAERDALRKGPPKEVAEKFNKVEKERDALRVELDDASHELAQLKMQLSPTRDVPKPGQAEAERWQEEAIRLSKKIGGMDYTISEMQKSVEKALRIEYRESDAKASWDWLVRQIEILRDNDEEDTKIRPPKAGVDYAATVEVDWPRLVDSAKLEALVERKVTEVIRRLGIKP